ncbi:MAG: TldD/PmbA family protein [Planctomycetes bacterium]|nr:TldD/PmbA family protein [Planctomycetota bacterium]
MERDRLEEIAGKAVEAALARPGVREAEAFVSDSRVALTRVHFASAFPSNGVEEPKSMRFRGVGVTVSIDEGGGIRVGHGSEPADSSPEGIERAIAKAIAGAVPDPDFTGFPAPAEPDEAGEASLTAWVEPDEETFVELGWAALEGALETFSRAGRRADLIVSGDCIVLSESMAIANSHGVRAGETIGRYLASITAMHEGESTKGTGYAAAARIEDFDASAAGREAAESALRAIGGTRIESGRYRVVLSPRALWDLLLLVVDSLSADTFRAGVSPYLGKFGEKVASEEIDLIDDGRLAGGVASRSWTCEGLPTGRTVLLERGRIRGLLIDHYGLGRLARDSKAGEKLGGDAASTLASLRPRNASRYGAKGGRSFARRPSSQPTNIVLTSPHPLPREELLRRIGDGVYIGRLWYSYPVNGLAAGDVTSTIVADSYIIEGGKIAAPLLPNVVRINDSFVRAFERVIGVGDAPRPVVDWDTEATVPFLPEVAIDSLRLDAIAR